MSTQSHSIASCLSCIAANRLVLSIRGLCYINDVGHTTIATTNSKQDHEFRASIQFRDRNSTFALISSHYEAVDVAMEEVDPSRREQTV